MNVSSGLLKILIGIVGIGILYKTLPLFDLLNLFFMIVVMPLTLCAAFGLVGMGTLEVVQKYTTGFVSSLRSKISEKLQEARDADLGRDVVNAQTPTAA